jgi:peptide/nickel transport system substrate-binding protein
MKLFLRIGIVAVVALMLGLLTVAAQDNSALIVATQIDDVITFDPGRAYETTNLTINHATYDTLLEIRSDDLNAIVPSLAESYTVSDDGLVYTFALRSGVTFASGNPLTAEDVRWSWTRLKNLKGNPAFYADQIASIEVVDDLTAKVTLTVKYPAFATIVTAPALSVLDSKLAIEHGATDAADADTTDTANDWLTQNSAGSGPFVLTSWTPLGEVTLVRNDSYWRGAAALSAVTLRHSDDATTKLQLLQRGDVDIYENVDKDLASQIGSDLQLVSGNTLNLTYLAISPSPDFNLPLSDAKVRQAIAKSIDFDGIINGLLLGYATRPAAPLPVGIVGSDAAAPYSRDIEGAKALLAEAGFADGFDMTIYIGSGAPGGIPSETLAAKIQADLAEAGINVTIDQRPTSDFLTAFRAQELSFVFSTWTPDYLDATMWSDYFSYPDSGLSKRVKMDIPEIADLATKAGFEVDPAKRAELYAEYVKAHVANAVFVPLFQPQQLYALRSNVQGFAFHPVYFMDFYGMSKS